MTGDASDRQNSESNTSASPRKKGKVFKSGPSIMHAFVRFTNRTLRRIDVVWLNYEGIGVKYKTLGPGQYVDVNTYAGHPWIFRDSATGEKMVVHLKEVYEPVGWHPDHGPPQRRLINITIPVYSLKDRSLLAIRQLVRRDHIRDLDIPNTLKEELLETHTSLHRVETNCDAPNVQQQQPQLQQYIQDQLQQQQPQQVPEGQQ